MIINGGSRAKQTELARHLLRADTNETVRVFDLSGVVADDLMGALSEMAAIASGSRCTKFLYHASISPGETTVLTDAQWRTTITALEKALGLTGHQRAVVMHTKNDRQHAHVVWNRVDVETLKAAHHSHNYRTHEAVARAMERAFGLEHVQGVHIDPPAQRPERRETTRQSQQAARTGWPTRRARQDITAAWTRSETGTDFAAALTEIGYRLARGDRKAMVVLDPTGGVHGVPRSIEGVRVAEMRKKVADLDPTSLPSIEEARAELALIEPAHRPGLDASPPAQRGPEAAPPERRPDLRPAPQRFKPIKVLSDRRGPVTSHPYALTPRPAPPSWAYTSQPVSMRPLTHRSSPATQRPAHSSRIASAPPRIAPQDPQHQVERLAQRQRQDHAAAVEAANLTRFHMAQLAELDRHHGQRLTDLVHAVDVEIKAHDGIMNRLGHLASKAEYHRKLAYLVAKREGIRRRESERQDRVRAELKAAHEKERAEAAQRRAVREQLERDALERRLADRQSAFSQTQKDRPGLDGPGG